MKAIKGQTLIDFKIRTIENKKGYVEKATEFRKRILKEKTKASNIKKKKLW